ncbi:hypothetical protein I203_103369 [Kwoniella mangroviensis CBS 8507]|uniref:uncharacterized protein n=1 Tax=Kwoniella mangroviensis CBS 8507 TaxID=1296122 RepID=UPI003061BFF8
MIELTSGSPKFKKLIYSSHAIESPYTLKQKGLVEAVQDDNDQWHFSVGKEKGLDLNLSGLLSLFAEEWSQFNNMEEYDPGLVLNPVQYFTRTINGKPPKRNSEPMFPYALQQVPPEVLEQIRIVGPEEYERVLKEAMIEATKIMKANWTSLKKVYWWQDRNKRPDSPTRDYLRWTAVLIEGPELMYHDLIWSDEGSIPPDVEEPLDERSVGK